MNQSEQVINKIRKCLALATSPNENEAQRAAQKAHELLIRHNLSMQQIECKPDEYEDRKVDTKIFRKTVEKYVDTILVKHFFVKVYDQRIPNNKFGTNRDPSTWYNTNICIFGTQANAEIASYIRMYLVKTFQDLWREYKKINNCRPREEQSYYMGLYSGLSEKLGSQTQNIESETGLAIIPDPNLEDRIATMHQTKGKRPDIFSNSLSAGYDDGQKIQIKHGISQTSKSNKYLGEIK